MSEPSHPIPWPSEPLRDDLIELTPFRLSDVDAMVHAAVDPEIQRWTSWPSEYDANTATHSIYRREYERLAGTAISFAIRQPPSSALVGGCDLRVVDHSARRAEVAYWIMPDARGRSVATRAVTLVSHWAIRHLGMRRVEALVQPENAGSRRVLERSGFQSEGLLRAFRERRGTNLDLLMYSLLPSDLE